MLVAAAVVISVQLAAADLALGADAAAPRTVDPPESTRSAGGGADPFARVFKGDDAELSLVESGSSSYAGTLTVRGTAFPATATRSGDRLEGRLSIGGESYPFAAVLSGDRLRLERGGKTFDLTAGAAGGGGAARVRRVPPSLEGVYEGRVTSFEHPRGWYSFDLPEGWTVARQTEDGLVLNPGFVAGDTMDALILVTHGTLDDDDVGKPVEDLLDAYGPELRSTLASEGIDVEDSGAKASRALVGDVPGAIQTWKGRTSGGNPVTVWVSGIVKREYYLAVNAVLVAGKESRFLPGIKRVFRSLRPKPPEKNTRAEAALAGMRFTKSSSPREGSFHSTYEFSTGNRVKKEMMMSGSIGLGSDVSGATEEAGTYEVVGDVVYIYLKDGQVSARLVVEAGAVRGLKVGDSVYRAR